jgi:hypothetical protein
MATAETQVVAELGNDYKYGFHDPEEYFFKSGRAQPRGRGDDLGAQERARVDA